MSNKSSKHLLFSVTARDCDWEYSRSSGKGGQNVNKVSSKVRYTHKASGAVGVAQDSRDQKQNRRLAFRRLAESPEFIAWHRKETMRRLGLLQGVDEFVGNAIQSQNLRIEVHLDGKWRPIDRSARP